MIVASEGDTYRVVTQPDHAFLAGEILSLWRADGLPANERRGELLFAAREHDNGWREEDAAARCDGEGRPVDFQSMPLRQRIEIWERGTARFRRQHPYASLLIVRHARALHRGRRREEGWRDFLHRLALAERRLRQELRCGGRASRLVTADYRLLAAADTIALAVAAGWAGPLDLAGLPHLRGHLDPPLLARDRRADQPDAFAAPPQPTGASARTGTWTVRLAPLPLAGATTFRLRVRWIPRRRYGGDADLGAEIAAARWQEVAIRLAPGEEDETR